MYTAFIAIAIAAFTSSILAAPLPSPLPRLDDMLERPVQSLRLPRVEAPVQNINQVREEIANQALRLPRGGDYVGLNWR